MFYIGNTFEKKQIRDTKQSRMQKRKQKRMACQYGMKKV